MRIPSSHIYASKLQTEALSQGDIIFLNDQLKTVFLEHFKVEFDPEFLMVLSQSCDLVKRGNRAPKINHIILSLVRPFRNYIKHVVKDLSPVKIGNDVTLIKDNDFDSLRQKVFDLINNANAKTNLFLPEQEPFEEHMVAVFNTVYPLRFREQYDLLLENRVLSLNNDYKAKVGDIFSTLFDRVVVTELTDSKDWDKKKLFSFIDEIFEEYGLIKTDRNVIKNFSITGKVTRERVRSEIEKLSIEEKEKESECQLRNTLDKLKPDIIQLIIDCMKNNQLRESNDEDLKRKLNKLFDQKIYMVS